jgi:PAS domain S-box-containing protein
LADRLESEHDEEELLRSVALQNERTILLARQRAEQELLQAKERAETLAVELRSAVRTAQLGAEVGRILTGNDSLRDQLQACTASIVRHLDAAFARIWTLSSDGKVLELQASAGLYTHLDGPHGRVPVGSFKIGLIAVERTSHFTNDVQHDPRVGDHEWAAREGLVGFAGYPLLVQDGIVGVVAIFSRHPIARETLGALESVSDIIALSIRRSRAETLRAEAERERTALLAREQSARAALATTLRSIGDAVIATDIDARVTFMNPVAETLTGWAAREAMGKPLRSVFRIVNERTRKEVESPAEKVIRDGVVIGLANHTMLLTRDGTEVPIDDSGAPIRDDEGVLTGVVLVFRDIAIQKVEADRKEFLVAAASALSTVLDVRRTLSNLARLAVPKLADWCTVDMLREDGRTIEQLAVAHVDPTKVAMAEDLRNRFPISPDAASGMPKVIRTGLSELYSEVPDALIVASALSEEHLRILRELQVRSAMIVPLSARGRILGAMTFVSSESERRYTRDDLHFAEEFARRAAVAVDNALLYESEQNARRNADVANRAKDDFLATVSHELRTPLNAMLGWTRMLRSGDLTSETRDRALATIERNAVTQAQLIDDLLDVSRIISGKLRLDVQSVEFAHIVEHAIEALRLASEARSIGIVTMVDDHAGTIMGDAHRLQQVVWNLLSNAIKFTPKGGRIHLTVERVDSSLKLTVVDSGRGIPAEFLPQVFERFKQADGATTRSYGGLGLGLAISRHIVELHGGSIHVESKGEGLGSTFTVLLPVSPLRQETHSTASRLSSLPGIDGADIFALRSELRGLKILIVDDEEDARELLVAVLEKCGAVVASAGGAAEALEKIRSEKPDVLVSDIGMPVEDGYSLIRKVRALGYESGANIPAAALTAYARAEDRRKALDAGYMMHVPKPVEPAELVSVVANLARFAVRR